MSLTSDVDYTVFQQSQQSAQDENLMVRFFHKTREDKKKTEENNGVLHLKEVEYIEIRVPGERDPKACRPATFDDKQRFERHYEAFKARTKLPEEGFPIRDWAQVTSGMAEHLEFVNIKTVEQLANASDTNVAKIMNGLALKDKAKKFLEDRNSNDSLRAENEALNERLARLEALMDKQGETKIDDTAAKVQKPDPDAELTKPAAPDENIAVNPELETTKRRSRKKA